MVFFSFMLKILVFALCVGVGFSVLVFVPLTLYVIPYAPVSYTHLTLPTTERV